MARFEASLVSFVLAAGLVWAGGCAQGSDNLGSSTLSGGYSAGPTTMTGGSSGGSGSDGNGFTGGQSGPSTMTTPGGTGDSSGGADDSGMGNPLCCVPGPQSGCQSPTTEACVCTSQPTCCQAVWTMECVDLAIACGDPFCTGETGVDTGSNDSGGPDLPCDPDFSFSPANPAPGVAFTASFTDPVPLVYIDMYAEGPGGTIQPSFDGIPTSDPWTWDFGFTGLAAGVWTFTFTRDMGVVHATCQKQI